MLMAPFLIMVVSAVARYLLDEQVNFTGYVLLAVDSAFLSIFLLSFAWFLLRLGALIAARSTQLKAVKAGAVQADLVRIGAFLGSLIAAVIVLVIGAQSMGVPLYGVLTGLGVGGIAVALAAQRSLENFLGALALFSDRPIRAGDLCSFGDQKGTVERIGLRSTRIRTLDRTVIFVPNGELSMMKIENLALRDRLLFQTPLTLALTTSEHEIEDLLTRLRATLQREARVDHDTSRVRLVALGPDTIDLEVFAYIATTDWSEYLAVREALYLQFLRDVEASGTQLAPPAVIQYNADLEESHQTV